MRSQVGGLYTSRQHEDTHDRCSVNTQDVMSTKRRAEGPALDVGSLLSGLSLGESVPGAAIAPQALNTGQRSAKRLRVEGAGARTHDSGHQNA